MDVLLVVNDLYKSIGGGQTVYRRIVEATPQVNFYYFAQHESSHAIRPANATAIPLASRHEIKLLMPPPFPGYYHYPLREADVIARSVAGRHFDIVDIPDFYTHGSLLRDAFARHNVSAKRIVLAMHGNISVSMDMAYGVTESRTHSMRQLEQAQFNKADGVYAISPRYIREWQAVINRPVYYIDPLHFIDIPETQTYSQADSEEKPSIYCIGRMERRKGNDLFIDLVRWIDKSHYHRAVHVGDIDYSYLGIPSTELLARHAKMRDIEIPHQPSLTRSELAELFAAKSLVLLPVRYDTLNLVVLEALFAGCPVAVSSKAGVCDYLDQYYPNLPYIKIDMDNMYGAVSELESVLTHYDSYRGKLAAALKEAFNIPRPPLDMQSIYQQILHDPVRAPSHPRPLINYSDYVFSPVETAAKAARKILSLRHYNLLRAILRQPKAFVAARMLPILQKFGYIRDVQFFSTWADAKNIPKRLHYLQWMSEENRAALVEKRNALYDQCRNILYRCNFWLDIARVERKLGNELMAVTYELRALRLAGSDKFGALGRVIETLEAKGFAHEAAAAQALYADPAHAEQRVYEYLQKAYLRNKILPDFTYEKIDDRRSGMSKVAVIVSLYNAAPKLKVFLTALIQQTLYQKGQVEVILVDSGSPDREAEAIAEFWKQTPMNAVYARSQKRETIQSAWNRGISLAKAPYLVFLGVDETLFPEALETLAAELDENPAVDWVMGNSLVTEVDEHGVHKRDVMPYNRNGASKEHVYLETCFLSWVGGMYRADIHERFGYYDDSFGAAGDTEIKNRILPFIQVKFIPQMLGLFLNYPDERTTASPKAEIEDLRAWYIHRTPGGIRYAYENRPVTEMEPVLHTAMGYRKSYCGHLSSDIDYAAYLSSYMYRRNAPMPHLPQIASDLQSMLVQLQANEYAADFPRRIHCLRVLFKTSRLFARLQKSHIALMLGRATPHYHVQNDNRYEQHSWLWRSS